MEPNQWLTEAEDLIDRLLKARITERAQRRADLLTHLRTLAEGRTPTEHADEAANVPAGAPPPRFAIGAQVRLADGRTGRVKRADFFAGSWRYWLVGGGSADGWRREVILQPASRPGSPH